MIRKYSLAACALAVGFVIGVWFSYQPVSAAADAPVGKGKCLGMNITGAGSPSLTVYRSFEDGTIESCMPDAAELGSRWESSRDGWIVIGRKKEWRCVFAFEQ